MNWLVAVLCVGFLSGCSPDLIRDCDRTMGPINVPAALGEVEAASEAANKSEPDTE